MQFGLADLANMWSWLENHQLILAAVAIVGALVAAKLVDIAFSKAFTIASKRTQTDLDDKVLDTLHRPIQVVVLLIAGDLLADALLRDHALATNLISKSIYTLIVVLYTWTLLQISRTVFKHFTYSSRVKSGWRQLLPLFNNIATLLIILHGVYVLLSFWGINVTPLMASAGIATAVVALASKDTLANFFGGISIFVDRPYQIGDYIVLESGERGEVVAIGMRSTRILTRDDVLISVPNSEMAGRKIINQSGQVPRYRIRVKVGVSYDSDPDQVERELLAALGGVAGLLEEPKPRVRFREFGDSALNFELLVWIHWPADRGRVMHEINKNIHAGFKRAGIDIPYPQRVVHLRPAPGASLDDDAGD